MVLDPDEIWYIFLIIFPPFIISFGNSLTFYFKNKNLGKEMKTSELVTESWSSTSNYSKSLIQFKMFFERRGVYSRVGNTEVIMLVYFFYSH